MSERRTYGYPVVGGPNHGAYIELRDERPFVRLPKPLRIVDFDPGDPVPETAPLDDMSTLYTVRQINDRFGPRDKVLAPESMPDHEVVRRYREGP